MTQDSPHIAAYVCTHVLEGAPILYVAHDSEGDWQFLCGAETHGAEECKIVGLNHLRKGDRSLEPLESMCAGHHAERTSASADWKIVDETENFIRECVEDLGWSVQLIPEDEEGPGFAYTVGLFHNYKHAELIVFGLRNELMHFMLNEIGERIKAGKTLRVGERLDGVIEGYQVTLREVHAPASFKDHVGYARWFYEGKPFPLFQVVWPDKQGRFPDEAGAAEAFRKQQPTLP